MVDTMTDWAIPQQAKLKYTQLFNIHDRSRSGFLSGLQCRDILLQSGLARNILAEIWNLSDIDGDGQLTREEFILAMHLTNQIRAGHCLPKELPADLIPPSYRRTRTISGASVQSATSSTSGGAGSSGAIGSVSTTNDKAPQDKAQEVASSTTTSAVGSVLNSNSFEDKRRENYERGRAELERRRLKIIEQQTSVLSQQLASVKKQVAEAKAKIDVMRADRDTKAGLTTSLEAQLKTVRDRKVYLDHEELNLIAIAKDLKLVNSIQSAELDEQAIKAKQQSIDQMRKELIELQKEKENKSKELEKATSKSEELKKELRSIGDDASKSYEKYKEKLSEAKVVQAQLAEENKSNAVNLDSIWDSAPSFGAGKTQPDISTSGFGDDSWAASSSPKPSSNDQPFSFSTATASGANEKSLEQARDYSALTNFNSNLDDLSTTREKNFSPDPFRKPGQKCYRALYSFEARNPDELTINPGDIINGTEEVCEPGWLSGESNGKYGLFPEAYVELIEQNEPFADVQTISSPAVTESAQPVKDERPSPIQPAAILPPAVNATKYRAIYAFDARNHDELTLTPGDIITGLDGVSEPGWLMGELNGQRGLFPEAYVEKIVEATPASTEAGGKSRTKRAEVATAIANYRALGQEQLNLEKGQLVQIRRKMDSGWWEGELQVKDPQLVSANDESTKGNELVHLIKELVESELDYITDLRLFRDAYIEPLTGSFDVGPISRKWPRIIEVHEFTLRKLSKDGTMKIEHMNLDSKCVMQTFKELLENIVDLYIEFCPSQNESTRLIETKIASDIRFKQLINESQRWLRKILERNEGIFDPNSSSSTNSSSPPVDASTRSRALRNAKLPLTSFLIKPMQRITKYSLIFSRLVKIATNNDINGELLSEISCLNSLAQSLCNRVNEACRVKEDEENNQRKLRWSQSHIKQSGVSNELRHSTTMDSIASSGSSSTYSDINWSEKIDFCSKTKHLGMRRLIKAGSVQKMKSSRELILFLYNDFLLITQAKGGVSVRAADVFKSERAQQTYYKIHQQPILLEDLVVRDSLDATANMIQSEGFSSQRSLSLSDNSTGSSYDLICVDSSEHSKWQSELIQRSKQAIDAHARSLNLKLSRLSMRPTLDKCFARLFLTLIELRWACQTGLNSSNSALYNSLSNRPSSVNHVQKVRVEVQLCRHEHSRLINVDSGSSGQSIIALSELFKTKRVSVDRSDCERLQFSVDNSIDGQNDSKDTDWSSVQFDEESTQFLMPNDTTDSDFLEIDLIEDSRFKITQTLACKKLSLNRMLGREAVILNSSMRRTSTRTQVEKLEPNRPRDCVFKLKSSSVMSNEVFPKISNMTMTSDRGNSLRGDYELRSLKWSIKLRLYLQLFCDNGLNVIS